MTTEDVPSRQSAEPAVRYLLFVCNHNAGRSQMAQAFFERDGPSDVRAESAGTEPARAVWPPVIEAMREIGIDLTAHKPNRLTLEMQLHADWAITMGCGEACPYVPTTVEDWDIPDPAGRPLDEVRAIREGIEARVQELIAERLEAIRTDRTAHEMRLRRLLPMLAREFGETKPAEEIRACADAVLCTFEGARVRSHIMTLAHRQTRDCLRQESCAMLAR